MAESPRPDSGRVATGAVVGVLLLIPIVGPLLVTTYARETPTLAGFPFFYWFQFLWILISAAITGLAYLLVVRHKRRVRDDDLDPGRTR